MPAKAKPKAHSRAAAQGAKRTEAASSATGEVLARPTPASEATLQSVEPPEPQNRLQTRKSNQNKHPGEQHNRYTTRRRTKEEIAQDEHEKAVKIMAEKYENIREHQSKIDFAAQLESNIRQKQQTVASTATRPDLALSSTKDHQNLEDGMDHELVSDDVGDENLPYTSGDDSEHVSIPGEVYDEDFDDGKGSDPDYVEFDNEKSSESDHLESDVEIEASQARVTSKKPKAEPGKATKSVTKAAQRAAFRSVVSQQAKQLEETRKLELDGGAPVQNDGTVASAKRKVDGPDAGNIKRPRPADIGGLRPNWKALVVKSTSEVPVSKNLAPNVNSKLVSLPLPTSSVRDEHANGPTGEFDQDEDIKMLHAVRAKKGTRTPSLPPSNSGSAGGMAQRNALPTVQVKSTIGPNYAPRSTLQMGIKFEPTDVLPAGEVTPIAGSTKKSGGKSETKYTNSNLPFPQGRARVDLKTWQKTYLPELYDWAGTLPEPFGSNSHPELENVVAQLWVKHFPHLMGVRDNPAILGVATGALRNWRSEIGKAGLRVVTDSIKGLTRNEIVEYVAYQIPSDGQPGYREAWLSTLILETFAWHVTVTMKVKASEHYPFGALALCAASVERALKRWQTGVCEEISFSDSLWGAATDGYARSTATLNGAKWAEILSGALQFAMSSKQPQEFMDGSGQEPPFEMDPRAMITD
ncbi:hypothetical protein CCMSSC00406_0008480 [Pleurotus cornucopiae]|uniref:Uncharacterized protein n=1 Tax=Pleurotus cornucopiae TaxID=5321 RepID=A0ACB7IGU9_PLECO|nr:hypothetical protein CCMSSC00406_0008480 [Pleurotus cornucopiae]